MIDRRRGGRSHVRTFGARVDRAGDERGSASVLVALWVVVLTLVAGAAVVLTSVLAVRESLSAATDLAALAGASAALLEPELACARAGSVARANDVTLTQCRIDGMEVWVTARAPTPAALGWLMPGLAGFLHAGAHAELVPWES